ncbi:MAG: family 16 glycoside hydrolase, partial [Patescibacteria group bacterium]
LDYVYQDTDDNASDFLIQTAPNPQNSGDIYTGSLLYSENFDSNQAQDWATSYTYGGAWQIDPIPGVTWDASQGQYRLIVPAKDQGSKSIYQGGYDWQDYTFSLDVALNDGVDRNIIFRYQDDQNYYSLGLRGFWHHASNDTPVIYLAKCYQGVCHGDSYWQYFAAYHFSNPQALNNEVAQIKIKAVGGRTQVFYNENLVIDYTETKENYSNSGTIGFLGWSGGYPQVDVGFDNLTVREE